MNINSVILKLKSYKKISDDEYQLQSLWTSSDTVEMNNGESLEKEITDIKSDISNLQDLGLIIKNGVVYDRWEEK